MMRLMLLKTPQQQAMLAVHRPREGGKAERTVYIYRVRGLLTELCLVFAQSPDALRIALADVLEGATNELPALTRTALQEAHRHCQHFFLRGGNDGRPAIFPALAKTIAAATATSRRKCMRDRA